MPPCPIFIKKKKKVIIKIKKKKEYYMVRLIKSFLLT